jgi:glycoprotease/Kae1 family metallohydrolase
LDEGSGFLVINLINLSNILFTMKKSFLCLGIESTAHTFGVAVVESSGKILSDVRDMFTTKQGGLKLDEVAEHHKKKGFSVIEKALKDAKAGFNDIDLISFSRSPGLAPCLVVGMNFAKKIAKENNVPLIGVNHCVSHLSSGLLLTKAKDPVFVFTSGANTQIIAFTGGKFRIFGETLDVGLGNALDKFGRGVGLGFPCGPKIEKLAKKGKYVELPYSVKGMDLTFSGIVTHTLRLSKEGKKKEDLCYSIQENFFSMLTEVSERALAHTGKDEVVLIGGVAANKRLCEMMDVMCKERDAEFYPVGLKYSGDNAAMIAWQGILQRREGSKNVRKWDIDPRERVDMVKVEWM